MVMVSGAGGLQGKGGRSPPPKRGRLGGGRCICDTLLSPSACSTEGFFRRKNAFRIQRSRATGFSGRSPEPFLHPFVGTKGCPRRVGVPIKSFIRLAPPKARRNDDKAASRGMGRGTAIGRGGIPAEGGNGGRYPRRRRMTRTLISAGETPLMRLAWPILAGRMRRSFSTASSLNPRWAA